MYLFICFVLSSFVFFSVDLAHTHKYIRYMIFLLYYGHAYKDMHMYVYFRAYVYFSFKILAIMCTYVSSKSAHG